jgi:hypothetical protein
VRNHAMESKDDGDKWYSLLSSGIQCC